MAIAATFPTGLNRAGRVVLEVPRTFPTAFASCLGSPLGVMLEVAAASFATFLARLGGPLAVCGEVARTSTLFSHAHLLARRSAPVDRRLPPATRPLVPVADHARKGTAKRDREFPGMPLGRPSWPLRLLPIVSRG